MNGDKRSNVENIIKLEIDSAHVYNELAKLATNNLDRQLLRSLSLISIEHANRIIILYKYIYMTDYFPSASQKIVSDAYIDELKNLYTDILIKYYLYDGQLKSEVGYPLSDAYFRAKTDANNQVTILQNLIERLQK